MRLKTDPNERQGKRLLRYAFVAAGVLLALGGTYLAFGFFGDGLSGGAIMARAVDDDRVPLVLDEARVRGEMPALARLLDEAAEDGSAEDSDPDLREKGVAYLRALCKEMTGRDLYDPPHGGVVGWKGTALEVSDYVE